MKKRHLLIIAVFTAIALVISFTIGEQILQGTQPTLISFSIVHFLGYLFFLLMPVEALMPLFISQGYNPLLIFSLAMLTAIPALIIDFWIGHLVPKHAVEDLVGAHRSGKYERYLDQYGKYVILFFGATPLSSPLLTTVAGMVRFPFWQLMAYTIAGLAFKYAIIVIVSGFF